MTRWSTWWRWVQRRIQQTWWQKPSRWRVQGISELHLGSLKVRWTTLRREPCEVTKGGESTVNEAEANFYKRIQWMWVKMDSVRILVPHIHWKRNQVRVEVIQTSEIKNGQVCTVCAQNSRLIDVLSVFFYKSSCCLSSRVFSSSEAVLFVLMEFVLN